MTEERLQYESVLRKLAFANQLPKMAEMYKGAPFQSESQRRKFYAMERRGEISKKTLNKWESETPKGKKLPERKTAGVLGLTGMGMTFLGKKPTTRIAGTGLFLTDYGVQASKGVLPSVRASESLKKYKGRRAEIMSVPKAAEALIEMQKEAIIVRDQTPGSQEIPVDTAAHPPYEKKNYLKDSSDRTASRGAEAESATSGGISGPGSLNLSKMALIQPRLARWWRRGVPGIERETKAQAPEHLRSVGKAMTREPGAGTAPHIQSGNV